MTGDTEVDGFVSPEFDLQLASEHDDAAPQKRQKLLGKIREGQQPVEMGDEEALALALLRAV